MYPPVCGKACAKYVIAVGVCGGSRGTAKIVRLEGRTWADSENATRKAFPTKAEMARPLRAFSGGEQVRAQPAPQDHRDHHAGSHHPVHDRRVLATQRELIHPKIGGGNL